MRKRHKTMKKTLVTVMILCAALCVGAQSPLGLTYPLGVPDLAVSGASAAMGGGGTAAIDENIGASLNPANVAIGNRSVFSALISYDLTNIHDNGASSSVSGYMPKLLSLIIPLGPAGNAVVAMQKRYDANLNFYTKDDTTYDKNTSISKEKNVTTNATAIELRREGGLSSWQAGWAYRFGDGISVGLIYEYLFFNRDSRNVFESTLSHDLESGTTSYKTTVTDSMSTAFSNHGIRFGMQIPVHEKVTLGFAGEYVLSGNGTKSGKYILSDNQNNNAVTVDSSQKKFSVTLPPSVSIGAAYAPDAHWLLTADANTTMWQYYKNDGEPRSIKQGFGLSAGARYIPAANILSSKYWEKVHYSAGVYYATLPNDNTLDRAQEYALSVGAGLPIPRDGGMVDIVLSYGGRSDPKYSGYEENVVKLQLGLSGGRNWFQKDASKDY